MGESDTTAIMKVRFAGILSFWAIGFPIGFWVLDVLPYVSYNGFFSANHVIPSQNMFGASIWLVVLIDFVLLGAPNPLQTVLSCPLDGNSVEWKVWASCATGGLIDNASVLSQASSDNNPISLSSFSTAMEARRKHE